MAEPRVVPRAEHQLSRKDVDPDALKVLYHRGAVDADGNARSPPGRGATNAVSGL